MVTRRQDDQRVEDIEKGRSSRPYLLCNPVVIYYSVMKYKGKPEHGYLIILYTGRPMG